MLRWMAARLFSPLVDVTSFRVVAFSYGNLRKAALKVPHTLVLGVNDEVTGMVDKPELPTVL